MSCKKDSVDQKLILKGRDLVEKNERLLQEVARFNATVGREARLRVFLLLTHFDELTPCDISEILGYTMQTVSDHLSRLRTWGVVNTRREGRTVYYSLKPEWKKFFKKFFKMMADLSGK
ncbi:MAG: winged helix-turn-helix transcriptional regulator [Chlorobi bacterium]|nr:winged helix-turn-helix transcriptional regulator [Chlorobiota bacterium]